MAIIYTCTSCGRQITTDEVVYRCPDCAPAGSGPVPSQGFQRGNLSVVFQPSISFARGKPVDPHAFLPLPIRLSASFPAGGTPLVAPDRLQKKTGFSRLFLKLDSLNPSGSLKDRASLLVAEQAKVHGFDTVTLASTGNAGASMACAGAACGLTVVLFVPGAAPRAKLLQSLMYGARVVPIQGTYDDAFALSIKYTREFGGINRNTGFNPFTVEGKKTVSIELYNQLGCRVPDVVYVPVGDGVIISGACKGFADLVQTGLAVRMPVMVAVQARGSNAIARSWKEGREVVLSRASTIADSLSVASPACGRMALDWLTRAGGRAVEVSDEEISRAQAELARGSGAFVEPSSAAAWAGFLKDQENVDRAATVAILLTGTGFKDTGAAEKLVSMPEPCPADLSHARELLDRYYPS
ncbi:MAG: pyridoxal-phosphate dependent enzyme [Spirochaetia bacterium]|jgi:threonine synthase